MRLLCEERDKLWAEYDIALKHYIESVRQLAAHHHAPAEFGMECEDAREMVNEIRAEIQRHATEHGCEPVLAWGGAIFGNPESGQLLRPARQ